MPGKPYDGHTLEEATEQAEILSEARAHTAFVDTGYRGARPAGARVCRVSCGWPGRKMSAFSQTNAEK